MRPLFRALVNPGANQADFLRREVLGRRTATTAARSAGSTAGSAGTAARRAAGHATTGRRIGAARTTTTATTPGCRRHHHLGINPGHGNHWITLKLEGVQSNRGAIGARICVVVQSTTGEHKYYKTVGTGGSFGASPLRQEMGLGQAQAIARVEIFWPRTGKTQVLTGLEMDRFYRVREDQAEASLWNLKSFRLGSKAGEDHSLHHHS